MIAGSLIRISRILARKAEALRFPEPPVAHVYNPLVYARVAHEAYLSRYADGRKRVVFLGMNPGPFGMMQTAVPFGEVTVVRDWLGIESGVERPEREHPRRPVEGFGTTRSEVSGRRLWGLFRERFGVPGDFFTGHFVANYCPLALLESSGRNFTPDRLPSTAARPLTEVCDAHLREMVRILEPRWVVGVGNFARRRAGEALRDLPVRLGHILHPSPASPAANRDWAGRATAQLREQGIWSG